MSIIQKWRGISMVLVRKFLFLISILSFPLSATDSFVEKTQVREPGKLQPPHVKLAIEHVAKYSLNQLKRRAYRMKGCALHPYKRSFLHAAKHYYYLLGKYFVLEYKGVHADDEGLTNRVFREGIGAMIEQANHKDEKDDAFKYTAIALGIAALAT